MTEKSLLSTLQGLCEGASDQRSFIDAEGYLELIRPTDDGDQEPLGLAVRIDPADDKAYLVLRVHLDPVVLDAKRVDAEQVIQAAADYLFRYFEEESRFLVTDLDCYGDPDEAGILRVLDDEDLDGDPPVAVELFGVQLSPEQSLEELGNELLGELVLAAPIEVGGASQ
ncbi:MAG: hypothetical protein CMH55_09535 [Myxococcales bacterium]|nr:hypothetical protein [Myxococcales bacterium]